MPLAQRSVAYYFYQNKNLVMRKLVWLMLLNMIQFDLLSQNTGSISGKITDKQTNEVLPDATVSIKGTSSSVVTNNEGNFIFQKVKIGNVTLIISYVGYRTAESSIKVAIDSVTVVNAQLIPDDRTGDEVVISASKRREKITNAPASIQVIGTKDLNQFPGSNVTELVSKVEGVEYTRSGVDEIKLNARGLNSAFNIKVFQLVDGRNSMTALSGGGAIFNNGSTNKDDIERVEIVLGPQSALYGPNAHNALFNYITKDPRKYQGTTISVSAGSQNQFSSRFRHAIKINNKWAYKLSGEHATGRDYTWYDTVYAGNQPPGATPFYGPAVSIPERIHDFTFRRYRGETQVYYSITPNTDIIVSAGGMQATRLNVTTAGRNQLRDLTYGFLQARFVHPRFFANIYNTWGNLGKSKSILIGNYTRDYWNRTHSTITDPNNPLYKNFGRLPPDSAELFATRLGNTLKERSQRLNAEGQYNYEFKKAGLNLVTGLSYQKDKPNGYGNSLVDSFQKITTTQYGAVLQLDKSLPWNLRFISTTRFDHHSTFGSFFAPRFALTKTIGAGTVRITWGKAYAMPSIQHQYAGVNRFLFGNGNGIYYIPNGTNINDKERYSTTSPLKPEEVNTWEFGYKGTIAKKLFIDINYYNGISKNFISPTITVPGRVLEVGGVRVTHNPAFAGVVINDTLRNAQFLTFFNYGDVRGYGLDLGLNYTINKFLNVGVKYSWFGSDITKNDIKNDANGDEYVSLEETSLNAPNHRGMAILNFQNLCKQKLFVSVATRIVQQYDFYSGSQIGTEAGKGKRGKVYGGKAPNGQDRYYLKNFDWGPLGGFTTVDLTAGYRVNQMIQLNMGITNLFDTEQIEFVGSPSIGRLIMFELKVHVPNKKE
jgi:outer membrane receptor protein involved in Fe transport